MNKKSFEKYVNEQLKGVPLEKLQQELTKMQEIWIPQILEKKLKNHIKCRKCGKYSKEKDFKIERNTEVHVETTHTDAGYGDDDKLGEVERLYIYRVCPICKNKEIKDRIFIRIIRQWRRSD